MTTPVTTLPKPVVEALALRISQNRLELPVLPAINQEVLQLSFEEQCDGRQLSDLIHKDQSLASHLLRIANSPAYAPTDPIVSLQQAVTRLGIAKIREIVILVIANSHELVIPDWQAWIDRMFALGLATGLFAKRVAKARRWNIEEAFLCGLLHGIGRPVLLDALKAIGEELSIDVFNEVPSEIVIKTIDSLHPRVGGMLLKIVAIAGAHRRHRGPAAPLRAGQGSWPDRVDDRFGGRSRRRRHGSQPALPRFESAPHALAAQLL